jgi:phosphate transport system substrate-binding protein
MIHHLRIVTVVLVSLLTCSAAFAQSNELRGTLTLSGAWAIYPTAVAWGEAFQNLHPGIKVDISAGGAGKGAADAIAGLVDIGMVSREPDPAEVKKGITPVYVLHDAVFPVVSDKNPALGEIMKRGITLRKLNEIYVTGDITTWDGAVGTQTVRPIHVYTRSDSCGAAAAWAAPFGKKQEDLRGIGVFSDPGLLQAVVRDPVGLGYNNFSYVFTRAGTVVSGVRLLPIDANQNGKADPDEIFTDRRAAIAAIEAGKYPVTRKNYFFVKGKPSGLVKEFLAFMLSEEGTRVVDIVGTSLPLTASDRAEVLKGIE